MESWDKIGARKAGGRAGGGARFQKNKEEEKIIEENSEQALSNNWPICSSQSIQCCNPQDTHKMGSKDAQEDGECVRTWIILQFSESATGIKNHLPPQRIALESERQTERRRRRGRPERDWSFRRTTLLSPGSALSPYPTDSNTGFVVTQRFCIVLCQTGDHYTIRFSQIWL